MFSNKKGKSGVLGRLTFFSGTGVIGLLVGGGALSLLPCFMFFLSSSTYPLVIKHFLSHPTSFLAFTLSFLFPHPTKDERLSGAYLLPGLTPNLVSAAPELLFHFTVGNRKE